METSERIIEIAIGGPFRDQSLTIEPDETTAGLTSYHCYLNGASITQLRRDPSGKWTQLWGELPAATVQRVGEAIADYTG